MRPCDDGLPKLFSVGGPAAVAGYPACAPALPGARAWLRGADAGASGRHPALAPDRDDRRTGRSPSASAPEPELSRHRPVAGPADTGAA